MHGSGPVRNPMPTSPQPPSAPREGHLVVFNRAEDLVAAQREVLEAIDQVLLDRASRFAVRLALEEAVSNASRHGNQGDPQKKLILSYRVAPGEIQIIVEDEGSGFDPEAVPDPTAEENLEIPSGRGLMLMRAYMSEVNYNDDGNRVTLRYVWQSDDLREVGE